MKFHSMEKYISIKGMFRRKVFYFKLITGMFMENFTVSQKSDRIIMKIIRKYWF